MKQKFIIMCVVVITIAFFFGGEERYPDYNYKMTIHVGKQSFSTVRSIETEEVMSIVDSSGRTVKTKVTGEAVILDLPSGRTAYALLNRPENYDYAKYIMGAALTPHSVKSRSSFSWSEASDARKAMIAVKGPRDLPRTLPPKNGRPPFQAWPRFVSFSDPNNRSSARDVTPEEIGVSRITIEITDDPVTSKIDERLGQAFVQWSKGRKKRILRQQGVSRGDFITNQS